MLPNSIEDCAERVSIHNFWQARSLCCGRPARQLAISWRQIPRRDAQLRGPVCQLPAYRQSSSDGRAWEPSVEVPSANAPTSRWKLAETAGITVASHHAAVIPPALLELRHGTTKTGLYATKPKS